MNAQLSKSHIIVSGINGIMAREHIRKLIKYGANVTAIDSSKIQLENLKKQIPQVDIIEVNLTDWDVAIKMLRSIKQIDGLVNDAGTAYIEPFLRTKRESIEHVFDENLRTLFNVNQVIARKMCTQSNDVNGASIINITTYGYQKQLQDKAVRVTARGFMQALTIDMAMKLQKYNIRVNCIHPAIRWRETDDDVIDVDIEMARCVSNVVDTSIFLLSKRSMCVTGNGFDIES